MKKFINKYFIELSTTIIIMIIFCIIILIYFTNNNKFSNIELNENIYVDKYFDGLHIDDIKTYKNGKNKFIKISIKNENDFTYESKSVSIIFFNKSGSIEYEEKFLIPTLKKGKIFDKEVNLPVNTQNINNFVISEE